jgi:hypothetical protein
VSKTSPKTGAATKADDEVDVDHPHRADSKSDGPLDVSLVVDRHRHATWSLMGLGLGALLMIMMGPVAQGIGAVLAFIGAVNSILWLRLLRGTPGAFTLHGDQLSLPLGLLTDKTSRASLSAVSAVYLLRRAVRWNWTAPVLVIEVGDKSFVYPRSWFGSERDQRRIMRALTPAGTGAASTR